MVTMKEYTSLPAKRFVHLVHKYVHHRQMKQIEGKNVPKSVCIGDPSSTGHTNCYYTRVECISLRSKAY